MRKIRNQKWICLLMVITVMISGICLEKIPANSYFSCKEVNAITKADRVLRDVSACRTETLSQREVMSSLKSVRKDAKRNPIRAGVSTVLCLLNADIFLQNFQAGQLAGEDRIYYEAQYFLAILSYIHNQDGEKLNILFN